MANKKFLVWERHAVGQHEAHEYEAEDLVGALQQHLDKNSKGQDKEDFSKKIMNNTTLGVTEVIDPVYAREQQEANVRVRPSAPPVEAEKQKQEERKHEEKHPHRNASDNPISRANRYRK